MYYTEFLTLFWLLENEYRLEIRLKKVRKVQNIHNIPMVGSRPLECRSGQNELYMVFKKSFCYDGAKLWNSLPADMRDSHKGRRYRGCVRACNTPP